MKRKPPSDRTIMRRVRECLNLDGKRTMPGDGETFESLLELIRDLTERLQFERMSHGFCEQERIRFLRRIEELGETP